jgi:hypothetical protein
MSRTPSNHRNRATARPSPASIESLEGRQLFSAAPLAGVTVPAPTPCQAALITVRKAGGHADTHSIIGVLRQLSVQPDDQSIIAVLRSLAQGFTASSAVKIIAI